MEEQDILEQIKKLKRRIPYDEDIYKSTQNYENLLRDLLEDSMNIGFSILYPFEDFSNMQFPKRYYNWQIRVCTELFELAGKSNVASYSENGLSWTRFKAGLSSDLLNELISKVGTPKKKSEGGDE